MAITIEDQPYAWALRGQKLMVVASSTETGQTGFRYGVEVVIDAKTYNFYIPASPDDRLYFDLAPLLMEMRNYETAAWHYSTDDTEDDLSKHSVSFSISEWWLVAGVLTESEGSAVAGDALLAINGYFQPINGYKPNVESGTQDVKQSLTSSTSYAMSDRLEYMHDNYLDSTLNAASAKMWIPAYESDYGVLCIPGNDTYLTSNVITSVRIQIFSSTGVPTTQTLTLNGYDIEALPVYPGNLNDWTGLTVKPSLFPNWRFYTVGIYNSAILKSEVYTFYNAAVYGQKDCRYDNIRLGWVNSRGGWDYFNFIKKSETTNEIDRKKYRKVLFNGTETIFSTIDRGLQERRNLVQQVITITSDYISEGEFKFLRSLLVSNQVTWLTKDGKDIAIPVNLDDTSYTEKKTRDGKLYNLTLKMRIANEYWT